MVGVCGTRWSARLPCCRSKRSRTKHDGLGIVAGDIGFVSFVATALIGCPNLLMVINERHGFYVACRPFRHRFLCCKSRSAVSNASLAAFRIAVLRVVRGDI